MMNQNDNQQASADHGPPSSMKGPAMSAFLPCHQESDEVLGSLIIKIPLKDLDEAVLKSSREFFVFATLTTLLLVSFLILSPGERLRIL